MIELNQEVRSVDVAINEIAELEERSHLITSFRAKITAKSTQKEALVKVGLKVASCAKCSIFPARFLPDKLCRITKKEKSGI